MTGTPSRTARVYRDKTRLVEFGRFAAANRRQRGAGKPETFDGPQRKSQQPSGFRSGSGWPIIDSG